MSIHLSGGGRTVRRVVLSCDLAGCPIQVEPPPAEHWRDDTDARSWAREHAGGWTYDPVRQSDYCPEHARFSVAGDPAVAPRPTATVRDGAGNPLNRDDYVAWLRARLTSAGGLTDQPVVLTGGQAAVMARLLDELAGVYRGEGLGALASELSGLLTGRPAAPR